MVQWYLGATKSMVTERTNQKSVLVMIVAACQHRLIARNIKEYTSRFLSFKSERHHLHIPIVVEHILVLSFVLFEAKHHSWFLQLGSGT
jgi:hypothetical protein